MFITSTLSSKDKNLVLVAIKRVSSLLALHTSNLRALSHLLLDSDHQIRTAAAAHIRHISSEPLLCNKVINCYLFDATQFTTADFGAPQLSDKWHRNTVRTLDCLQKACFNCVFQDCWDHMPIRRPKRNV